MIDSEIYSEIQTEIETEMETEIETKVERRKSDNMETPARRKNRNSLFKRK